MLIGNILIQRALDEDKLRIRYSEDVSDKSIQIGTNSIDVTLAKDIYLTKPLYRTTIESDGSAYTMEGIPSIIDPRKPVPEHLYRPHVITDRGYMLEPGECILASAQQAFDCTDCNWVQHYEGRSTMARIFIMSHVTAGFGDYGFNGAFTLEIKNLGHHSVVLYPGMRIGQVYFEKVTAISHTYEGYTQTDFKPQLPRLGDGRF